MVVFLQQVVNGLMIGGVYSLIALGLTMTFGLMHIVNFAHGEIVMLGAFVTFLAMTGWGWHFFAAIVLAMALMALFGLALERWAFRFARAEPINGLLISIGLIYLLQNGALQLWGTETRRINPVLEGTLRIGGFTFAWQRLLIFGLAVVLVAAFYLFIKKAKWGKALRAVAMDHDAAALVGIPIDRVIAFAFAMGCVLAAAAGALIGSIFIVTPFMGLRPLLKGFVVLTMAGFQSILGTIVGSLILGVVESLAAGYVSTAWQDAFGFGILILVLMFRPAGLFTRA